MAPGKNTVRRGKPRNAKDGHISRGEVARFLRRILRDKHVTRTEWESVRLIIQAASYRKGRNRLSLSGLSGKWGFLNGKTLEKSGLELLKQWYRFVEHCARIPWSYKKLNAFYDGETTPPGWNDEKADCAVNLSYALSRAGIVNSFSGCKHLWKSYPANAAALGEWLRDNFSQPIGLAELKTMPWRRYRQGMAYMLGKYNVKGSYDDDANFVYEKSADGDFVVDKKHPWRASGHMTLLSGYWAYDRKHVRHAPVDLSDRVLDLVCEDGQTSDLRSAVMTGQLSKKQDFFMFWEFRPTWCGFSLTDAKKK